MKSVGGERWPMGDRVLNWGEAGQTSSPGPVSSAIRSSSPGAGHPPSDHFRKEVVEIHVLLTRSLFGAGIPRRLFLRVSLTKLISVALPC
jgi:hypothetical protein